MKEELSILAYNAGYENSMCNYYHWLCDLQKWLREEKKVIVYCFPNPVSSISDSWNYNIKNYNSGYAHIEYLYIQTTYEQALEAGLKKALEELQIMKNLPHKIYLQVDPNNEKPDDYNDLEGVTFSTDRINKNDVEYVINIYNKCDKGWHSGECCCNCKNQIELFKHPWNKVNKGPISESTKMYACIAQLDCDGEHKGVIFEQKHGFCEMHLPKKNQKT